jgi:NAD(P)-dependent dehydrogenase (short-subunit alcohol dehydrogenase family)
MEISLAGRTAIVTGASKGIGRAIAAQLAASGANVMLSSRKLDQLEIAAAEIAGSGASGETAVFAGNAGDLDVAAACVAATIQRFGRLDILVNNAATNPYYGPTLGIDPSRFDKTVEVNVRGPLYWCRHAWEAAFRERPGVIVNVSSVGGLHPEPGLGVYNVTKAALIHLTRQLASELGPTRVVGVAPGLVQTDFASVLVENFGEALARQLPTQRLGEPVDIANLVTFLVSDAASWITGETYVIDGGGGVRLGVT